MNYFPERHLAAGGSRGSSVASAGFRLRLRTILQRLLLGLIAIQIGTPVYGDSRFSEWLPQPALGVPGVSPQSGLSCVVEGSWFGEQGYRPIRFIFRPKAARTKDVKIGVTVHGSFTRGNDKGINVGRSFTLSAGETEVRGFVYVPLVKNWDVLWWEVTVDGKLDKSLSVEKNSPRSINRSNAKSMAINTADAFGRPSTIGSPGNGRNGFFGLSFDGRTIDFSQDATKNWLTHSSVDCLHVGAPAFASSAERNPEAFLALRKWLMAGGTLWITQVSNGKEGLKQIEHLLDADGWDFGVADDRNSKPVAGLPGWHYESLEKRRDASSDTPIIVKPDKTDRDFLGKFWGAVKLLEGVDSQGWYAMRSYGFGRVMAFPRSPYNPPPQLDPKKSGAGAAQWRQRNWTSRHGLGLGGTSRSFGNLLIPGVGIAPVTEFQFLITLFVLAIGPLNYWLLRRSQRLHLLVITAPLAALVVTTGLFAYALVSDGFGVKTRARSVTLINQVTGEATSWSRLSQYAASSPKGGYAFPDDTAVYPILPTWGVLGGQEAASREVIWHDGEQLLLRGWLPTRTAVQHLVVRSRATTHAIRFSSDGKEASNRLGADVELLLVHHEAGEWYRAEGIAEGAVAQLEPIERTAAVAELRLLVTANQPEFPIGAGDEAEETLYRFGDRSSRRRRNHQGARDLSENLLNKAIGRLSGLDGSEALDLPPGSYVAVTRQSVETPLGLRMSEGERTAETGSFHVIVGRW